MMGACVDRLDLSISDDSGGGGSELAGVKAYLRVEHEADDDLITAFIAAAKQRADDFLQNPFEELRTVIAVESAAVGDSVYVDGLTFRVAATAPESRDQDTLIQEFAVGDTDEETAEHLADLINDDMYGALSVIAEESSNEVRLRWRDARTGLVKASEVSSTISVRAQRTQLEIPETVRNGVLRTIAWMYEQRQDGVGAETISGLGGMTYSTPPIALTLWAQYRKNPGL